ncbi:MAG TPA: M28 family peptidase [Terriglobales bacterium]|nr:M28 family peptidase [Terriglobales bacterium]
MRKRFSLRLLLVVVLFIPFAPTAVTQAVRVNPGVVPWVCERCIRAHEEFLASDAMQGRGSGTHDELVAATYAASALRQYGIEPAGDHGSYIQVVPIGQPKAASQSQSGVTAPRGHASVETVTWNAVGILRGSDPSLQHSAILLSAHLDHLGIGTPVNGDNIYNGADDDASGTAAVLELARLLSRGRRPRRTVIFALFGSEELGGVGSTYFSQHPPLPLKDIAANLELEMIGRPDPAVKGDTLWLTGWDRSNLGPVLAAHGAQLVRDPHPAENFFARSDNFVLAQAGVVAQTISSYGLHKDYHQPSDDLAHLDFRHMDAAIASLVAPVEWLVNSSFQPKWNVGGKP